MTHIIKAYIKAFKQEHPKETVTKPKLKKFINTRDINLPKNTAREEALEELKKWKKKKLE